jgi:hypothetical protein
MLSEARDFGGQGFDSLVEVAPVLVEVSDETQEARRKRLGGCGQDLGQHLAQGLWTLATVMPRSMRKPRI